eukprot:28577_1
MYVLESELLKLGNTQNTLWPWYRNTFHCGDNQYKNADVYNELRVKYHLVHKFSIRDMRNIVRKNWTEASRCQIFVQKENKWYNAAIVKIEKEGDDHDEWLFVEYRKTTTTTKVSTNEIYK